MYTQSCSICSAQPHRSALDMERKTIFSCLRACRRKNRREEGKEGKCERHSMERNIISEENADVICALSRWAHRKPLAQCKQLCESLFHLQVTVYRPGISPETSQCESKTRFRGRFPFFGFLKFLTLLGGVQWEFSNVFNENISHRRLSVISTHTVVRLQISHEPTQAQTTFLVYRGVLENFETFGFQLLPREQKN